MFRALTLILRPPDTPAFARFTLSSRDFDKAVNRGLTTAGEHDEDRLRWHLRSLARGDGLIIVAGHYRPSVGLNCSGLNR